MAEYEAIKSLQPSIISSQCIETFFETTKKKERIKPRVVMIDMEEGVIKEVHRTLFNSDESDKFDKFYEITDRYGSGNNWAYGYFYYGLKHYCKIEEIIRKAAESCNNLESFFMINSLGGGTGSGVGTFILSEILKDDYPSTQRICFPILAGEGDSDVITSPYNTLFSLCKLNSDSDCVIPFENEAITRIISKFSQESEYIKDSRMSFSGINDIIAQVLLNFTSSSRYHGSMNIDMGEFSTNLIPFPKLNFLVSAQSPVNGDSKVNVNLRENLRHCLLPQSQNITKIDIRQSVQISTAICIRGKELPMTDILSAISSVKRNLRYPYWNEDSWKIGHCHAPSVRVKANGDVVANENQVLCFSNTTGIVNSLIQVKKRFDLLFKKKAHLHHYLQVDGFDETVVNESIESFENTICEYESLDGYIEGDDINNDFDELYSKISSNIF